MRNFSIDIVWAKIQMAVAAIGGWLGYFLGGMDGLMIALIVFMALDYITGLMCAVIDKKLSSAVGFKGICKKVLILMLVGVAHIVDLHVVGTGDALRSVRGALHLAGLGWQAVARQGAVGLIVAEGAGVRVLPPATGAGHMLTLCRLLVDRHAAALADPPGTAPVTEALSLAARTAPTGAHVVLATLPDGWQGADAALSRLARGRRVEVALILDPLETAPPARPLPVRQGGATRLLRLQPADLGGQTDRLAAMGAVARRVEP